MVQQTTTVKPQDVDIKSFIISIWDFQEWGWGLTLIDTFVTNTQISSLTEEAVQQHDERYANYTWYIYTYNGTNIFGSLMVGENC